MDHILQNLFLEDNQSLKIIRGQLKKIECILHKLNVENRDIVVLLMPTDNIILLQKSTNQKKYLQNSNRNNKKYKYMKKILKLINFQLFKLLLRKSKSKKILPHQIVQQIVHRIKDSKDQELLLFDIEEFIITKTKAITFQEKVIK